MVFTCTRARCSLIALYAKREELDAAIAHLRALTQEWGGDDVDRSSLDGLISVKRRDIQNKRAALESFDFEEEDIRVVAQVVEDTETRITALNEESYRLRQLVQRIEESLESDRVVFKPDAAEALFREAGVVFGPQLKKDFGQLIRFNRAITKERRDALSEQLSDVRARIDEIAEELTSLNAQRSRSLDFLRESDALAKYKELSTELTTLQAELNTLESKRAAAARLIELRRRQRTLAEEFGRLQTEVEDEIESMSQDEDGHFGTLRRYFTDIIYEVLGHNAILAIRLNSQGGLDFTAEIIGESGIATSGNRGTSYRKLLCIAFDLAMLRAFHNVRFPRFVYHDGALEQLEPRKREKLIGVFRSYADHGLQPIISLRTVIYQRLLEPILRHSPPTRLF